MSINHLIESIGIELEGGLNHSLVRKLERLGCDIQSDGSVHVSGFDTSDAEILFHTDNLIELDKVITTVFNSEDFGQNSSCGNHIHVKFKNMDAAIARFSFASVQKIFCNRYLKFARTTGDFPKYKQRLSNSYSKSVDREEYALEQMNRKKSEVGRARYTAINLNSVDAHGTIEFRLFPYVESAEEYRKMVAFLIETIEVIMKRRKFSLVSQHNVWSGCDFYNCEQDVIRNSNPEETDLVVENRKLQSRYFLKLKKPKLEESM